MVAQNMFLGMDIDSSYVSRSNKRYNMLINGELISNMTEAGGLVVSATGNRNVFKFPNSINPATSKSYLPIINDSDGIIIVGEVAIGDYIILFTTTKDNIDPLQSDYVSQSTRGIGMIWAFKYDKITNTIDGIDANGRLTQNHLVFYDNLNFSANNRIYATGVLENSSTVNIYFTDNYNFVRHINILEDGIYERYSDHLFFLEKGVFGNIKTIVRDSGSFKPGTVEYSAQFYNYNGTESQFISTGNMVNLASAKNGMADTSEFVGSEYKENANTNKSTLTTVEVVDSDYESIKVVRLFYETEYSAPKISIVYDGEIPKSRVLNIIDDGIITYGTMSFEEFVTAGNILFKALGITNIKKMLLFSNVEDDKFDIDYDARAYSFPKGTSDAYINDSDGSQYSISTDGTWAKVGGTENGTDWSLPNTADAINPDPLIYNRTALLQTQIIGPSEGITANFIAIPTSGTEPLTVSFIDSSIGSPTSWMWDFGDGSSSTLQNPQHTYSVAGTYSVGLAIETATDLDHITKTNYITVNSVSSGGGGGDPATTNAQPYGGTGKNVSYEFRVLQLPIDNTQLRIGNKYRTHGVNGNAIGQDWRTLLGDSFINNTTYENYSSAINASTIVGYQRMETYRFGVVLFDEYGRRSTVKWIADIKIPGPADEDDLYQIIKWDGGTEAQSTSFRTVSYKINTGDSYVGSVYGNNIYLKFNFKNIPAGTKAIQIVRVPRKSNDKTILGAGLMLPTAKLGSTDQRNFYSPVSSMRMFYIDLSPDHDYWTQNLAPSDAIGSSFAFSKTDTYGSSGPFYPDGVRLAAYGIQPTVYSNKLFNIISPEIEFYRDPSIIPSDIIVHSVIKDIDGYIPLQLEYVLDETEDRTTATQDIPSPFEMFYKGVGLVPISINEYKNLTVENGKFVFDSEDTPIQVNTTEEYRHLVEWVSLSPAHNHHIWRTSKVSPAFVGTTDDGIRDVMDSFTTAPGKYDIAYVYMHRNVEQYGGNTFEARVLNKYLPVSPVIILNGNTKIEENVFGGDSYIAMFETNRLYISNESGKRTMGSGTEPPNLDKTMFEDIVFPVETSVNIDWRTDKTYSKLSGDKKLLSRDGGYYYIVDDDGSTIHSFTQDFDTAMINYSYMRENNAIEYFPKQLNEDKKIRKFNHRIVASVEKTDNEISDSWLKFPPLNFADVSGTYGDITAIHGINENLYFFQTNNIGVLGVRRESLVTDKSGIDLSLGTGGLFSQPTYLAINSGLKHRSSIVYGEYGLYFYDYLNKEINRIGAKGIERLSKIKHINNFLEKNAPNNLFNGDNYGTNTYVSSGFNKDKDSIYFTFNDNNDGFTISFNESYDEFMSLHDFRSPFYILNNNMFYSINRDKSFTNSDTGWVHDDNSDTASYYDEQPVATKLSFTVNDNPALVKVFDTIEYDNHVMSNDGTTISENETFSSILVKNMVLSAEDNPINAKYKFKTWRALIPRVLDGTRKGRFVGRYANIELVYNNSANKNIEIFPIVTHYRQLNATNNT